MIKTESQHIKTIKENLTDYFRLLKKGKFDKAMNYIHPGLFDLMPRKNLVEMMEHMFNNPQMSLTFDSIKILEVSKSIQVKNTHYSKIDHGFLMVMTFGKKYERATIEEQLTEMKLMYGEGNVYYDKSNNLVKIWKEATMIGFFEKGGDRWYFLENKPEMRGLYDKFVPKEVVEKLGL